MFAYICFCCHNLLVVQILLLVSGELLKGTKPLEIIDIVALIYN